MTFFRFKNQYITEYTHFVYFDTTCKIIKYRPKDNLHGCFLLYKYITLIFYILALLIARYNIISFTFINIPITPLSYSNIHFAKPL